MLRQSSAMLHLSSIKASASQAQIKHNISANQAQPKGAKQIACKGATQWRRVAKEAGYKGDWTQGGRMQKHDPKAWHKGEREAQAQRNAKA
jgi:hypothetical protein